MRILEHKQGSAMLPKEKCEFLSFSRPLHRCCISMNILHHYHANWNLLASYYTLNISISIPCAAVTGSNSELLTTAKTVSFLIRTEENSTSWTVFHTFIIEAAIMTSNSYSFTQISTWGQIRWSLPSSHRWLIKGSRHYGERGRRASKCMQNTRPPLAQTI